MAKKSAVFLDRDGVLNEVVMRGDLVSSPRSMQEFRLFNGLKEPLQTLKACNFCLFVVSNQPDIARGLLKPSELEKMTNEILTIYPVDRVLACPHDDSDDCSCRKPKPGMLLDLACAENIALETSYIVGDSKKDIQAGYSAGCRTILLSRKYNQGVEADFVVESLLQAVNIIQKGETGGNTD